MDAVASKGWLKPGYLFIILGPAVVFLINQLLLQYVAEPFDLLPARLAEFDMYKEGAARIGMLAAFMLFIGAALGALVFFAYTLRMLDWPSRGLMIVVFLAFAGAAVLTAYLTQGRDAHDYVGKSLACLAAGYDQPQSVRARMDERSRRAASRQPGAAPQAQPGSAQLSQEQLKGVPVEHLANRRDCAGERFDRMQRLGEWQFYAIALAFSGLVLGAICCLATSPPQASPAGESGSPTMAAPKTVTLLGGEPAAQPAPDPAGADAALRHWEKQSEWVNTYLYLAALLLGTALLFINAYLRFPAFVLLETGPYEAYVATLVSYYGFTFTVMLAAFYIPVATILAGKVSALKPAAAPGESKLPAAFKGPLQLLKIVLGLLSTALAGTLPGILALIA